MWIVITRLLEDDDESTREKAAQLVSQTAIVNDAHGITQRSELMVSRALECAFATLTHNFAHSQVYIEFLIGCVDELSDSKEEGIGKISGTRVLFDQEDTNAYLHFHYASFSPFFFFLFFFSFFFFFFLKILRYVEQLTSTQLGVAQLQKLLRSPNASSNSTLQQKLTHLLSRMVNRIKLSSQQLAQLHEPASSPSSTSHSTPSPSLLHHPTSKQKGSLLLRWVTYEKDVFTPLYRAALSLAALSSLLPSSPSLVPPPSTSLLPNMGQGGKERERESDVHPLILHALREWQAQKETPLIAGLPLFFLTSVV